MIVVNLWLRFILYAKAIDRTNDVTVGDTGSILIEKQTSWQKRNIEERRSVCFENLSVTYSLKNLDPSS